VFGEYCQGFCRREVLLVGLFEGLFDDAFHSGEVEF